MYITIAHLLHQVYNHSEQTPVIFSKLLNSKDDYQHTPYTQAFLKSGLNLLLKKLCCYLCGTSNEIKKITKMRGHRKVMN